MYSAVSMATEVTLESYMKVHSNCPDERSHSCNKTIKCELNKAYRPNAHPLDILLHYNALTTSALIELIFALPCAAMLWTITYFLTGK